jgi:hypothetical protein
VLRCCATVRLVVAVCWRACVFVRGDHCASFGLSTLQWQLAAACIAPFPLRVFGCVFGLLRIVYYIFFSIEQTVGDLNPFYGLFFHRT